RCIYGRKILFGEYNPSNGPSRDSQTSIGGGGGILGTGSKASQLEPLLASSTFQDQAKDLNDKPSAEMGTNEAIKLPHEAIELQNIDALASVGASNAPQKQIESDDAF
ncbi:hypothetical protein DI09_228p50, partial [Mitosporidium daphniae]